jgi:uncharacterized protein (DUF1501 family)
MLTIPSPARFSDCDGLTRRNFIKLGALGATGLALPDLLRARASASGKAAKETSVVWLWLGGGATHIETFDPKMSAPKEYRSVTGQVSTSLPGVTFGGTFDDLARFAHRMAVVRSFAHGNSGHGGGTHWVMTGYDNRQSDSGGRPNRPSMGAIAARLRGANHSHTGMPTYVRLGAIGADGPAFLGPSYAPFDPQGQARRNLELATAPIRLDDRRHLLDQLDRFQRHADATGLMEGLDHFEQQAFDLVLGNSAKAFDLTLEDPRLLSKYGKGPGEQLLVARRLCEAGCGFVTVNYGGWDMHGNIKNGVANRGKALDRAVAAFIDDVAQRGLDERILLVITGEFGRTPRINRNAGRDHWAPLSTLALSGGGLKMGQVVGESNSKAEIPKTTPVTPQDLMATVFHVLGIDLKAQLVNPAGRPVYLVETGAPISELV